ncbi:hypothetical protein ZHAS_00019126 [Anopheles sinensis]|uniref:Uncharacterized protein n=1 Tax=Anopheles sinensis TaxID=74873 RepID=A0A084WLH7_ANOSI|nr:hypothetical protein ZHAS_00019126 [Anopheles sinensis]
MAGSTWWTAHAMAHNHPPGGGPKHFMLPVASSRASFYCASSRLHRTASLPRMWPHSSETGSTISHNFFKFREFLTNLTSSSWTRRFVVTARGSFSKRNGGLKEVACSIALQMR